MFVRQLAPGRNVNLPPHFAPPNRPQLHRPLATAREPQEGQLLFVETIHQRDRRSIVGRRCIGRHCIGRQFVDGRQTFGQGIAANGSIAIAGAPATAGFVFWPSLKLARNRSNPAAIGAESGRQDGCHRTLPEDIERRRGLSISEQPGGIIPTPGDFHGESVGCEFLLPREAVGHVEKLPAVPDEWQAKERCAALAAGPLDRGAGTTSPAGQRRVAPMKTSEFMGDGAPQLGRTERLKQRQADSHDGPAADAQSSSRLG